MFDCFEKQVVENLGLDIKINFYTDLALLGTVVGSLWLW